MYVPNEHHSYRGAPIYGRGNEWYVFDEMHVVAFCTTLEAAKAAVRLLLDKWEDA